MDSIIDYDMVKTLMANPPSLDPCPNFFNLRALQTHFTWALKHLPCPQLTVNGWLGAVMAKEMYALVDGTPFKAGNKPTTVVPNFPNIFKADGITPISYTHKQTIRVTRKFDCKQNYYKACINIYCTVYYRLTSHIGDSYKVAPPTSTPTIGWNGMMTLNEIFNQLMVTNNKHAPDAMRQKTLHFWPHTIPRTLLKSYSRGVRIAKRLQLL
jgi:hypothetical protein